MALLTESAIKKLTPGEKRRLVCDADCLYLEITPGGVKTWVFRQRGGVIGEVKRVLGKWPNMPLYMARRARDDLRSILERKHAERGRGIPFSQLAEQWHEKKCVPAVTPKTAQKQMSLLSRYVLPVLGNMCVLDLSPALVLGLVRGIEVTGKIDTAHSVIELIGMIMRYGVACDLCARDITADLRGALTPVVEKHRASLTSPTEIGALLRAVDSLPDGSVKNALRLQAYTFVRPGELRRAEWRELDLIGEEWRIPAEKMKMRRPHIVPLSRQATALFKAQWTLSGTCRFVFPSMRTLDRPMSDMTLLAALRRLGYGKEEMTVHGFRSMASTNLNEKGWSVDAIERQLAHVEGNGVRAAYNYAQFLDTRRQMMQWYADWLDALRDGLPTPEKPS